MKTIVFLASMLIVSVGAIAQGPTKPQIQEIQQQDTVLIMKEGKVLLVEEGKNDPITTTVIVAGTKVNEKGEVLFEDGTNAMLQEGDVIMSDGKLVRAIIKARLEKEIYNKAAR